MLTRKALLLLSCLALALPLMGQSRSQLRKELRTMIRQAAKDIEQLEAAGRFAAKHGFARDRDKVAKKILKLDKDNEFANTALGKLKFEGKWVAKADYQKLVAKQLEAKYKDQGLQRVDGVWVKAEEVADAKRGVFHHDGELVNKWEKQQLQLGNVRHPRTGRFVTANGAAEAKKGMFPASGGRWVDQKEADKVHGQDDRPWVIRTKHAFLIGTNSLKELEKEAKEHVDKAIGSVLMIFGAKDAPPSRRPVLRLAKSTDQYKTFAGNGPTEGGADTVYGVYISLNGRSKLDGSDSPLTVMNFGEGAWRAYWSKHAAGLALSWAMSGEHAADVPKWFHRGIAGYCERHCVPAHAAFFGKQFAGRNSIQDLRKFFDDFLISVERSQAEVNDQIYQAGLLISYALKGGDEGVTAALMGVTKAFETGRNPVKAIQGLEKALVKSEAGVQAYLQKVTK